MCEYCTDGRKREKGKERGSEGKEKECKKGVKGKEWESEGIGKEWKEAVKG